LSVTVLLQKQNYTNSEGTFLDESELTFT